MKVHATMANNFVQQTTDALTRYTANLVAYHREYLRELPFQTKKNAYRPTRTLTTADKQRMQHNKSHPFTVPWYNLAQGEEMRVFTATTNGARLWKRLATKARIFLRSADLAFLTIAQEMQMHRRDTELAEALTKMLLAGSRVHISMAPESGSSTVTGDASGRRSSARQTTSDVNAWSKEFGYGLPMSGQAFSMHMAITNPAQLAGLGVDMSLVSPSVKGQWALQIHQCHHPMEALRQLGKKPLTNSFGKDEEEFNNGKSISCRLCGARWQRNARVHPGTMNSIQTGMPLRPFEIGIALPVPKGTQWSDEAVGHRLYCECANAVQRIENPCFYLNQFTFPHLGIMRRWPDRTFSRAMLNGGEENRWPFQTKDATSGRKNPSRTFTRDVAQYVPKDWSPLAFLSAPPKGILIRNLEQDGFFWDRYHDLTLEGHKKMQLAVMPIRSHVNPDIRSHINPDIKNHMNPDIKNQTTPMWEIV